MFSLLLRQWIPLIFAQFIIVSNAYPYESFPLGSQFPPIARENDTFKFVISNDTYRSSVNSEAQIVYNAYNLPSWLQFDESVRTFSGTPSSSLFSTSDQVSYFDIILQGTDPSDGLQLNKTYQLVLTNRPPIALSSSFDLLKTLEKSGYTNGRDALKLSTGDVFNVTFSKEDFTNSAAIVDFYGRSENYNAPLASWLFFDPNNVKFSGIAPAVNSQIAPEIPYNLVLIASDIPGYAAVEVPFQVIVGGHLLTTPIQNTLTVNASASGDIMYKVPFESIYLDNVPIKLDQLSYVELEDAPSWIKLSNDTLKGTVPTDLRSNASAANFSLAIYDIYGDVIYLNFNVVPSLDKVFSIESLPNINATRGTFFSYSFSKTIFEDYSNTRNVTIVIPSGSSWLEFNPNNLTLSGLVPNTFDSLELSLEASLNSEKQKLPFKLNGIKSDNMSTTSSMSSTKMSSSSSKAQTLTTSYSYRNATKASSYSTTESATLGSVSNSVIPTSSSLTPMQRNTNSKKAVAIGCGVGIPIGIIAIASVIFFLFFWRRKNNGDEEKSTAPFGSPPDIGKPKLDNPENRPNKNVPINPFLTRLSADEDDMSIARRIDSLNALKLDSASSSDSETSTMNEKKSHHDTADSIIDINRDVFSPVDKSSSMYIDAQPSQTKSWKYIDDDHKNTARDSYASLNTVSTDELLNTKIDKSQSIPKDPRKSTLGLRDSVFKSNSDINSLTRTNANMGTQASDILHIVDEKDHEVANSLTASFTSSSSDDLLPVRQGNGYEWVTRSSPSRKPSQKRFVKSENTSRADIGQLEDYEGHLPENVL